MPKWDDEEPLAEQPAQVSRPPAPVPADVTLSTPGPIVGENGSSAPPAPHPIHVAAHDITTPRPLEEPASYPSSPYERGAAEVADAVTRGESTGQIFESGTDVKVGILGGTGVGKSYLFQAMVYRVVGCGILHRYLRDSKPALWGSFTTGGKPEPLGLGDFTGAYQSWRRLPSTNAAQQRWYRVRLTFHTGLLGRAQWNMDVDFLDGSGEALEMGLVSDQMRALWDGAFREATIMVFCLPIWVLFPNAEEMTENDWDYRELRLAGFERLVATYGEIRNPALKVRTILALTMADDHRSALRTLRKRWIEPCIDPESSDRYFNQFRRPWGVPRYLASARDVSDYMYRELENVRNDEVVRNIYRNLIFGRGRPWLLPMSAVDGEELARMEKLWEAYKNRDRSNPPRARFSPRPAHVELPLLAAMVEWKNALM